MELIMGVLGGFTTFLGSATLRWLLGEVLTFFKAKQDHRFEEEKLKSEHTRECDRRDWRKDELEHARKLEMQVVEVKAAAVRDELHSKGILHTVETVNGITGIAWVDNVNHGVRPVLAVTSLIMLVLECFGLVTPTTVFQNLAQAVLGLYVGGRISHTGR